MSTTVEYNFRNDSDDPEFRETLRSAMNGDLIAAKRMLGFYMDGIIVEKDFAKADYWAAKMREHDIGLSDEEHMHIPML